MHVARTVRCPTTLRVRSNSNNNENTCRIQSIGWGPTKSPLKPFNPRIMVQPPNMDDLNLSDSDTDALFDTPAARKNKQRAQEPGADAGEGAAAGKARRPCTSDAAMPRMRVK